MANSTLTSFIVSTLVAAAALWSGPAPTKSGVQISPDGKQTLISKDVGTERWAIALNGEDGSVTGNVFDASGGEPRFVSCERTASSGGIETYRCSGADRCALGPCADGDWVFIADVNLPDSFFLPPLDFANVLPSGSARSQHVRAASDRPSGVRTTVGGKRALISKDVGGERWAITRDERDGSVTGNVFFPAGGDPRFVWCEQLGLDAGQLGLACYGADRCLVAACPREDWTFIANVALPESFFAPPESVSVASVVETLVGTMGDEGAFIAIVSALDKGYSFRQISRAGLGGRLLVSGDIQNRSGGFEAPENPPQGLFSQAAADRVQATLPPPPQLYVDFGEAVGQDERTKVITRLLDQGYSLPQVGQVATGATHVIDCNLLADPAAFRACVKQYGGTIVIVGPGDGKINPDGKAPDVMDPEGRDPCGNGRIDGGEQCDGANLQGESCESRGFDGGQLRCNDVCEFDTSRCRKATCGDNYADRGEVCDGSDLRGRSCPDVNGRYVGGRLLCTACLYDTSECESRPVCGNGVIERVNDQPLEECDGGDLGGKRCSDYSPYVAGLLRCNRECHLDFSDCKDAGQTECGNGVAEGNEQCDRADKRGLTCVTAGDLFTSHGFVGGELGCDAKCHLIFDDCTTKEQCGNGVAEGREYCDGGDLAGQSCQTVHKILPQVGPFSGGTLTCDDRCRFVVDQCILAEQCGDGVRDKPFEECDRSDFGGDTCERLFGRGGNLICTANCEIDKQSCQREQHCGDDLAEGTEQCDGDDLRGVTCESLGYLDGDLACGKDCLFDTSKCAEIRCGDGFVEGNEQCDGMNLGGSTCESLGYRGGGNLRCASDCRFNTSDCKQGPTCGNGIPEGLEECDGSTLDGLRGQTCESLGFAGGGTLRCYNSCQLDTRDCREVPVCTEQLCPDGSCVPVGADCCGGGVYCEPGNVCVEGGCCPSSQPIVCAGRYCMPQGATCCGGSGWCSAGSVCVVDGCCPASAPKSCLDGTCATADAVCCGNGTSCPAGTQCLPGGGCG